MNQVGEQAFDSFFQNLYSQKAIHPITEFDDQQNDGVGDQEITGAEPSTNDHVLNIDDDEEAKKATASFFLSFSNLTYIVKARRKLSFSPVTAERTVILNGVSGDARDGEILAVLGASGSGKSTLIDALAGRIEQRSLKGTVRLNGDVLEPRLLRAITAYVMQDDLLFPTLTVEETLAFAADFRLPRAIGEAAKKARVQALIDQLGLRSAAKTIIGDESRRGVSGGERRRVSIGVDIVHDPVLLFLDEPTSGLDSTSAFAVVKVLRRIALGGSVVVMSIHQPSYRIIGLFDKMIFLSKGNSAFRGSPGELPAFFSGFGRPVPDNTNYVEFALDLISELEGSQTGIDSLIEFNRAWQSRESNENQECLVSPLEEALKLSISTGKLVSTNNVSKIKSFANSPCTEILALARRSTTNSRRTPEIFVTRLTTVLISGLLLGTIYWRLDESPNGIKERLGLFAFAIATAYFSSCQYLPVFIQERHIFLRETAYNAYRRSSYAIAASIAILPPLLVLSIAFSVATFWPTGLAGGLKGFGFYTAAIAASFWAGNSLAVFISGLVPHVLLGFTAVVAVSSYFLLLSGFFIVRYRIPSYWIWLHYGSLIKYPFEAVMRSEFGGGADRCFVRGAEMFDGTPFGAAASETKEAMLRSLSAVSGVEVTSSTCLMTGLDVLKEQGITGGLGLNKWMCLVVVAGWGFLYRFLFYLTLLLGSKNKRN